MGGHTLFCFSYIAIYFDLGKEGLPSALSIPLLLSQHSSDLFSHILHNLCEKINKKMSQVLGTFVLNIGDKCTEHSGQMSPTFRTFFISCTFCLFPLFCPIVYRRLIRHFRPNYSLIPFTFSPMLAGLFSNASVVVLRMLPALR